MECIAFDINLKGQRTSQYKNYVFNSMVRFNGTYLGANNHGLFKLEGNKDNTQAINAEFEGVTTDLGIANLKRMHTVIVIADTTDDLLLTLKADDKPVRSYVLKSSKLGLQRMRKRVGFKQKGVAWSFHISNPNGSPFAIDSIYILPVVRHQGHV